MSVTAEALALLLLLLPGFVSSNLLDHVIVRKPKDNFSKVVEALVFTFIIYALTIGILGFPFASLQPKLDDPQGAISTLASQGYIWAVLLAAIALPLALGLLHATDLHMKVLRLLRITNKTARETTWLDVFSEQKRAVIVNLSGGRRAYGWPLYFSNDREEGLLYLYRPAWIIDGEFVELNMHGLFLCEPGTIESIEFTEVNRESFDNPDKDDSDNNGAAIRPK